MLQSPTKVLSKNTDTLQNLKLQTMSIICLQNSVSALNLFAQTLIFFKLNSVTLMLLPFYTQLFVWQHKYQSSVLSAIQKTPSQTRDIKHSKDAKRGRGKRKRVSIMQYNQEHLCWNSLSPLSRQLHICNILMRHRKKRADD